MFGRSHVAEQKKKGKVSDLVEFYENPMRTKGPWAKTDEDVKAGIENMAQHKETALQKVDNMRSPDMRDALSEHFDEVHYPHMFTPDIEEVEDALDERKEELEKMETLQEEESKKPSKKKGPLQKAKNTTKKTYNTVRDLWDEDKEEEDKSLLDLFGGMGLPKSVHRQVGYGAGLKLRRNPVMHGRGLYYPVGDRHYINFKQLMNEGAINIKDHKFKSTGVRKSVMGGNVLSAVKSVLQGEKPDVGDIEPLNDTERQYLNQLGKVTGEGKFNVPLKEKTKQEKLTQEFEILKGQIIAGNDNEELVKKFKKICLQCVSAGALPKSKVQDVLIDLAALGY